MMIGALCNARKNVSCGPQISRNLSRHKRLQAFDEPAEVELELKPAPDRAIDRIWREYKRTNSPALRNYLIIHYMGGHVRKIAQRLRSQLPPQVDVDDLVDEAYERLVSIIEKFSLDKRVRFETYASKHLLGAMRDYLRRIDPIPRLSRTRSKQVQSLIEGFHKRHGREPDAEELRSLLQHAAVARFRRKLKREPSSDEHARLMELVQRSFKKCLRDRKPAMMLSFNTAGSSGGESRMVSEGNDRDAMNGFEDRRRPSPLGRAELEDLRRWVTQGFSRRDRLIIVLYYYEQMTMREIGQTLGCSESRVSQRLESILECLRSRINRTGAVAEFYCK